MASAFRSSGSVPTMPVYHIWLSLNYDSTGSAVKGLSRYICICIAFASHTQHRHAMLEMEVEGCPTESHSSDSGVSDDRYGRDSTKSTWMQTVLLGHQKGPESPTSQGRPSSVSSPSSQESHQGPVDYSDDTQGLDRGQVGCSNNTQQSDQGGVDCSNNTKSEVMKQSI